MVARLDMTTRSRSRKKTATPENWKRTQTKRRIVRKLPHFTFQFHNKEKYPEL